MFLVFFAHSSFGQIADLYADLAKSTYETIHGTCEKVNQNDLISSPLCSIRSSPFSTEEVEKALENSFFNQEAEAQLEDLNCSIKKTSKVKEELDIQELILDDISHKIQIGLELKKQIFFLKRELLRQTEITNALRPSGFQTTHRKEYEVELANLRKMQSEVHLSETTYTSLIGSVWGGDTKTIKDLFDNAEEFKNKSLHDIRARLAKELPKVIESVKKEYQEMKRELLREKKSSPQCIDCWNLSNENKRQLFLRGKENNSIQKTFYDSPLLARKMECRLESRFGKGQDQLDRISFAGSLVATGGASLSIRAPLLLGRALATGTKLKKVSLLASKTLLGVASGLTTVDILREIDRECPASNLQKQNQGETCNIDSSDWVDSEYRKQAESNCILSIVLAASPLPFIAKGAHQIKKQRQRQAPLIEYQPPNINFTSEQIKAIDEAHLIGRGEKGLDGTPARIGNYTRRQLFLKTKRLKKAGIDRTSRRQLVESGRVGDDESLELLMSFEETLGGLRSDLSKTMKQKTINGQNIAQLESDLLRLESEFEQLINMQNLPPTDFLERFKSEIERFRQSMHVAPDNAPQNPPDFLFKNPNQIQSGQPISISPDIGDRFFITFEERPLRDLLLAENSIVRKMMEAMRAGYQNQQFDPSKIRFLSSLNEGNKGKPFEVRIVNKGHQRLFGCMKNGNLQILKYDPHAPETKEGTIARYKDLCR